MLAPGDSSSAGNNFHRQRTAGLLRRKPIATEIKTDRWRLSSQPLTNARGIFGNKQLKQNKTLSESFRVTYR
jgi:hypothetical protein